MQKHRCFFRYFVITKYASSIKSWSYTILFQKKLSSTLLTVFMVMQDVPPALLVRFLREHRSEWADYAVDAYSAASLKASPYAIPYARPGGFPGTQVILPLAHTVEHEEVNTT